MSLMVSCEIQFSEEESKTVRAEPATQGVFSATFGGYCSMGFVPSPHFSCWQGSLGMAMFAHIKKFLFNFAK